MDPAEINRLAAVFRVLGEPNRLRILCSLGLDCRPVSDIVKATGMTQTNVSFHLRHLREAGLVRPERRGPFVYYCLPDPGLLTVFADMAAWLDGKSWMGEGGNADGRANRDADGNADGPDRIPGPARDATSR